VQTHATDASVTQPIDALSSVCCSSRTRQTHLSLTRQTRYPVSIGRTCATCPTQSSFNGRFIQSDAPVALATQRLSVDRHTPIRFETSLRQWTRPVVDRLTCLTLAQISAEIVHVTDAGTVTLPASVAASSLRLTRSRRNPQLGFSIKRCVPVSVARGASVCHSKLSEFSSFSRFA
jgi:hypothetical protein